LTEKTFSDCFFSHIGLLNHESTFITGNRQQNHRKDESMKNVWLSALVSSEAAVQKVMAQLKTYGLQVGGHFWEDDLEKMAWMKPRGELVDKKVVLWAILGADQDFRNPAFRYGLSMLAIAVQAQRGIGFPIVILQTEGETIDPETLTTPLKAVDVFSVGGATVGAKLVAKVHSTSKETTHPDYRLDLYGNEHLGQWFEVGPADGTWSGGMFAVSDADIVFHGVGPKGNLPEKSVLNYPMEGLKLHWNGQEFAAWAVQNELDADTSYYVKVKGSPGAILFGSYSHEEEAEVFAVCLK
jgi:hypothetical protein